MKTLAIYRYENGIHFVKTQDFNNDACLLSFIDALDLNFKCAVGYSDTAPFLSAYKLPEQLDEILEFDETAEWDSEKFTTDCYKWKNGN